MFTLRWLLALCVSVGSFASGFDDFDELLTKSEVFRQFEKRLTDLEECDLVQQRLILKLTNELVEQKKENAVLRETVAGLKSQLGSKNETLESSPRRVVFQHTEQRELQQISGQKDVKRRLKKGISRRQQPNQAKVAFSAGLSHTASHIGQDQNIVFDKVTTNIANGYNSHHGLFIAPIVGTYVFYSSILAYNDREVRCRFVVNGAHSASMWARGTDGRHDQGSNMIIVQLNQGDDVSVQNMLPDDAIFGNGDLYSTFSGFLLRGEEGELSIIG